MGEIYKFSWATDLDKFPYKKYSRASVEGERLYSVENISIPSVTTILSATKDMKGLQAWINRVGKEKAEEIKQNRLASWQTYYDAFAPLQDTYFVKLPQIPTECEHNAHMFYLKFKNLDRRNAFIDYLKANNVSAVFHYIPLHTAPAGKKFGTFDGKEQYTTSESEKLVRLPMYYGMSNDEIGKVINTIISYNA